MTNKASGDDWNFDPEEQRALPFDESSSPASNVAPDSPPASPTSRCESCGRPVDRGLCAACASAFENVLVQSQDSTSWSETIEPQRPSEPQATFPAPEQPAAISAPNLDELFAALEAKPRGEIEPALETSPVAGAMPIVEPSPAIQAAVPAEMTAAPAEVIAPPAAIPVPRPAPVSEAPSRSEEPKKAAPIAKPAVPAAALPPKKNAHSLIAAAAVLLAIAVIGIPLRSSLVGRRQQLIVAPKQAPVSRASKPTTTAAAPAKPSAPAHATVPTAGNPAPAVKAALPVAAPAPLKPAPLKPAPAKSAPVKAPVPASAPASAARNDARVPSRLPKPAAPIASAPAVVAAAPSAITAVAAAPAPVAPEPNAPEPAAGPLGPFFELRQVDQPPQVASRVDPQLPENLQSGPINEIVIARVLVSQTGQPSLVSLLRRSKAGAALDQAVVAAVKQWTFTPASKGGDAVSCFMHVAVPVRRTE